MRGNADRSVAKNSWGWWRWRNFQYVRPAAASVSKSVHHSWIFQNGNCGDFYLQLMTIRTQLTFAGGGRPYFHWHEGLSWSAKLQSGRVTALPRFFITIHGTYIVDVNSITKRYPLFKCPLNSFLFLHLTLLFLCTGAGNSPSVILQFEHTVIEY